MSTTMSLGFIDTLQLSKRMQRAGLAEEIANEFAEVFKETQSRSIENLATKEDLRIIDQSSKQEFKLFEQASKQENTSLKEDIKALDQKIEQKIDSVRTDLGKDIEIAKQDILLKMGKMIYIATGLIITAIGISVAIIKI